MKAGRIACIHVVQKAHFCSSVMYRVALTVTLNLCSGSSNHSKASCVLLGGAEGGHVETVASVPSCLVLYRS